MRENTDLSNSEYGHFSRSELTGLANGIFRKSLIIDALQGPKYVSALFVSIRDHAFSTYAKFSQNTNIFNLMIYNFTCAYQGLRNISFSGNCACVLNA